MPTATERPLHLELPAAANVLRSLRHLDLDPLVGHAQRAHIARLAEAFPLGVQTACYECRLSERDDRVDLALCVLPPWGPEGQFQSDLTGLLRTRAVPVSHADRFWKRSLQFLADWGHPGSRFRPEVPFVWVAFDLDGKEPELPVPCLGLCVDQDFFARRLGMPSQPASRVELEALTSTCHEWFHDAPLREETKQLLSRCLSAGSDVIPRHLSFMLGRQPAAFKLDVRLPVARVADFLKHIEWPEQGPEIQKRIHSFAPGQSHVQLNLVLAPTLKPPLEVEFFTGDTPAKSRERFSFLERLTSHSLCSSAKARVLCELSSRPRVGRWGANEQPVALGWYVKLRFEAAVPSEAKVYVGLMPQPFRLASRVESQMPRQH